MKEKKAGANKAVKIICIAISIIMLISILPAFALTQLTFPAPGDDYFSVTGLSRGLAENGAVAYLTEPIRYAAKRYMDWQGSFVSVWLFGLNPMVFSITGYRLAMLVFNLFFVFAVYFFCFTFLGRYYRQEGYLSFTAGTVLLFAFYHCLPFTNLYEVCFWYTGAVFYFFTLSGFLVFAALLYRLKTRVFEGKKTGVLMALLIAGALFLGSNNLAASVSAWSGMTILMFLALLKKHPMRGKLAVLYAVMTAALVTNALAPGYLVRYQDAIHQNVSQAANTNVWQVLALSFKLGTVDLRGFATIAPTVGVLMLTGPVMFKRFRRNSVSASNPLLLAAATYLVFVAQYAPFLYALGNLQYGRIIAYRFFTAQVLYTVNLVNLIAFAAEKARLKTGLKKVLASVLIAGGLLLTVHSLDVRVLPKSHIKNIIECYRDGSMMTFVAEKNTRIAMLEDTSITDVVFEPMTKTAVCFGFDYTSENKNDLINTNLAEYYGKNSVVVKGTEE